jgi:hypothetical protein
MLRAIDIFSPERPEFSTERREGFRARDTLRALENPAADKDNVEPVAEFRVIHPGNRLLQGRVRESTSW